MSAITSFAAFFKMSKFITLSALDAKSQRYSVVMDLNLLHYLRLQLTFGRLRIDPLNLKGKSEQDHLYHRSLTLSESQKKISLFNLPILLVLGCCILLGLPEVKLSFYQNQINSRFSPYFL